MISTSVARQASTTTSFPVAGNCLASRAASVSAVKAAMSPNGMKMTRVTVKISTVPIATSAYTAPVAIPSIARMAAISLVMPSSVPRFCRYRPPLRRVFPRAVSQAHDHERTVIHASGRARLEIVDRVHACQFFGAQDFIAQGLAELRRSRLGGLQRALRGRGEDQPGVEGIRGKSVGGRHAVRLLIDRAEIKRDLLGKVIVGKLVGHDHGAGGNLDPLRSLAADMHEIRIHQRDRAVGLSLESSLG